MDTAKKSNMRHRPIGLGTQGLADAFLLLGMAFDSPEVRNGTEEGLAMAFDSPVVREGGK